MTHIRPKIPENPPFLKRVFDKQILTHHKDWQLPFPLTCGVIWIALIKKKCLNSYYRTRSNLCLALSLTHSHLVNLIDVILACKDANSILVEVVTVANDDDEHHVGNSLLQI